MQDSSLMSFTLLAAMLRYRVMDFGRLLSNEGP
jgi:hypothetical protein